MGEMSTIKVMRHLLKEWTLPEDMTITWDPSNMNEVALAEKKFYQYLDDGWMAFSEEPKGRRQIFKFSPNLQKILLILPLGGG